MHKYIYDRAAVNKFFGVYGANDEPCIRTERKSHLTVQMAFILNFEGGDREWFSSIRDLLYPGNMLKL